VRGAEVSAYPQAQRISPISGAWRSTIGEMSSSISLEVQHPLHVSIGRRRKIFRDFEYSRSIGSTPMSINTDQKFDFASESNE
jgi:hypothetical protein